MIKFFLHLQINLKIMPGTLDVYIKYFYALLYFGNGKHKLNIVLLDLWWHIKEQFWAVGSKF